MARLLFVSALDFGQNGPTQVRQRLVMSVSARHGFDVSLVNPQYRFDDPGPITVHGLPETFRRLPWRTATILFLLLKLPGEIARADAVVSFGYDPMILLPMVFFAKLFRTPIYHEITEYPDSGIVQNLYGKFSSNAFDRFFIRRFAGMIVISRALRAHVLAVAPGLATIIVPAIAAARREDDRAVTSTVGAVVRSAPSFTFVYAGSLKESKDGVLSLIRAFARVVEAHSDARLKLAGYGSHSQREAVLALIEEHRLTKRVDFLGEVPQKDILDLILSADAAVLCRPDSRQARGGFPTKLAEYLSTGRPVVVTDTSDIGLYLKDSVSAFLAPPDDVPAFAAALDRVLRDRAKAAEIGLAGLEVFRRSFEAEIALSILTDWLHERLAARDGR